ncbi:MAG TPA: ABC-2 family transporter protein [Myxococcota bacterium]|nr:ABC-2 family transporter protein [Myxococcota bacterium]
MKYLRDVYVAFFKVSMALEMQYRAANVIWLTGVIIEPVVYLAVWIAAAEAQGGSVEGYTPSDFAAYYLVFSYVNQFTSDWHMWEFQSRIQFGQFAFSLLRPVHPIHGDLAENLAHKLAMQVPMLPVLFVLGWVFHAHAPVERWALFSFVPALFLAFAVRFVWEWAFALSCFWTTRISAVNRTYFAILMFMSGRVAPVDLLPRVLQHVGNALPFRWMVAFPVELAIGRVSPREALLGMAIQLAWVALGAVTLALVWPRAVKRFAAVGG